MGVSAASGGGIRELAGLSKQHHHQAGVVQHLQPGLGLVQKTLVGGGCCVSSLRKEAAQELLQQQ